MNLDENEMNYRQKHDLTHYKITILKGEIHLV